MKIRDLIISYLFLAIFWFFGVSALNNAWLPITITAIILPLLITYIKDEKYYKNLYTRGGQCILVCMLLALASIFAWLSEYEGRYSHKAVAIANDIHTATQVEYILYNHFDLGTVRELQDTKHIVSLKTKNTDIISDAQVWIAMDKNIDISKLRFINHTKQQKTKEKAIKELSQDFRNKILRIEGVIDTVVELKEIQPNESNEQNAQVIPEINIYITTTSCAKRQEIIRIVKNIIFATLHEITDENLWIEFIREDCANKEIGTKCEPELVECKE
jgi:hypothetical protein